MSELVPFDSDVLIDVLRKDVIAEALRTSFGSAGPLGISEISRMETIRGCRSAEVQQRAEKLLRCFQVISLDAGISQRTDELATRFYLSHSLAVADALIVATALEYELPLLSKNQRDFQFVRDKVNLKLLLYPSIPAA